MRPTSRIWAMLLLLLSAIPFGFQTGHAASARRYAVVIVLDGARPSYLNLAPMPNLEALEARGTTYQNAFVGQEIANTPPSHATIGTGLFPKHHGVQGFMWKDPATGVGIRPTTYKAVQRGELEQVMLNQHVTSIAGAVHARSSRDRVVSASGHKCYASDALGAPAADYILCAAVGKGQWVAQAVGKHLPPPGAVENSRWAVHIPNPDSGFAAAVEQWKLGTENSWVVNYALWAFKKVHYPRVLMINLPETDVIGHYTHTDGAIRTLMQRFDTLLGEIVAAYRKAGILDRTDFVVTADHGMSRAGAIVPYSLLTSAIKRAKTTPVTIEGDTAAAISIKDFGKARQVAVNIAILGGDLVDATYYKVRLATGAWKYRLASVGKDVTPGVARAFGELVSTMASPSSADVFAVYVPHATTRTIQAHGYTWSAGHLGPQWEDQHIPMILAGPGVRRGFVSPYPARLVDIAPTMERLLGLHSGKMDGLVLADAVRNSTQSEGALQDTARDRLDPLVAALKQRSGEQ